MDQEYEITPDISVKDFCLEKGIFIKTLCNGLPSCAECRVHIVEGEHNVLPPSAKELSLIGTGYYIDRRRLSCQLRCFGDVTIDISEQIEKQNEDLKERRPQGAIKKDVTESSHAVLGSFLEQEGELDREELQKNQKLQASGGGGRSRSHRSRHRRGRGPGPEGASEGKKDRGKGPSGSRKRGFKPKRSDKKQER